jgi:uncharacterized membrane protein YhaH (DUF805 family)
MIFLLPRMDLLFSAKSLLFIDALLALLLVVSIHGHYEVLFSARGRIKRLTFWEGMVAWFLLNILCFILGIAHSAFGFYDLLAVNFGDTDHIWYHRFVMAFTLVYWLGSVWILAVLCAKRWHDLNFSGWLALINAMPFLTFGYAWYVFLDSLSRTMNHNLASDPGYSPFDLWREVERTGLPTLDDWSYWSLILSCGLIIALGAYLGFAKGDSGANAYGKTAA